MPADHPTLLPAPRTLSGRGTRERDRDRESDREPLLSPREPMPTPNSSSSQGQRNRAVSLTASIASFASAASTLSNFHLPRGSSSHSRQVSASASAMGKRRDSTELQELSDSDGEDEHASLLFSDDDDEFDFNYDEEMEQASEEPLVRRRRRFDDEPGEKSLLELVAPLVLAHPLALFPALASVPNDFLPAGVALFVPLFCVVALLSACAHIVIVYLAWYLKVRSFEDVFAACAGERFGRFGLGVGRAFVIVSTMASTVGFIDTLYPLLEPVAKTYLPHGVLQSRLLWTLLASVTLIPVLIPSRSLRGMRYIPIGFALLLPLVAFLAIGRTVEIKKLADEVGEAVATARHLAAARHLPRGLSAGSAGSGLTMITMFFTPHLQTLSVHSTLQRTHRQRFAIPCLVTSILMVVISLPLVLVPYYLLDPARTVFAQLPDDDAWTNTARILTVILVLASSATWLLRGQDCVLTALDLDRGERIKAGRWVGLGMWALVATLACVGGVIADKIELLGVIATLAVGWLMPSLFFIITFHVRSPLAIIFPGNAPPPVEQPELMRAGPSNGHARTASLDDPSVDLLLARKERQLQKRRQGRRRWQDMVVYLGILPVGCVSLAWCVGSFLGLW